jgi:hypothetical protein
MAESATANLVKVSNGLNSVDFTGDGISDLVVIGHRENFNAHSFEVASFYISVQTEGGGAKQWDIVPLMDKNKEKFEITIGGGADCVLHDFRLIAGSGKVPAVLILADRDMGGSYADSEKVTFTFFRLITRKDNIAGFPPHSFERTSVKISNVHYCDVTEAFQKELGIGTYAQ